MNDTAKIRAELKNRAADSAQEAQLITLLDEIIARFEAGSSQGVTSLLEEKMEKLRQDFDAAHAVLQKKMGGPSEGG